MVKSWSGSLRVTYNAQKNPTASNPATILTIGLAGVSSLRVSFVGCKPDLSRASKACCSCRHDMVPVTDLPDASSASYSYYGIPICRPLGVQYAAKSTCRKNACHEVMSDRIIRPTKAIGSPYNTSIAPTHRDSDNLKPARS